jgi:hypothetical protein
MDRADESALLVAGVGGMRATEGVLSRFAACERVDEDELDLDEVMNEVVEEDVSFRSDCDEEDDAWELGDENGVGDNGAQELL